MSRKKGVVAIGRDGEILSYYESIAEAARMNGFSESAISHAVSSGGLSHRIRWMDEQSYRDIWMKGKTDTLKYSYKQINSERVRKGWMSVSAEKRNGRKANIRKSKKKLMSERPEVMEAAIRSHFQPVLCISTGECFESIKAFADAYGFRRDSATSSIRNGYKVHGLIVKKITKEEYETYNKKRNQEND